MIFSSEVNTGEHLGWEQGDQIGRIFRLCIGLWFTLGSFFKKIVATDDWATFFHSKRFVLILTKMGCPTFWATF
jgi:hypothetical protein